MLATVRDPPPEPVPPPLERERSSRPRSPPRSSASFIPVPSRTTRVGDSDLERSEAPPRELESARASPFSIE